MLNGVPCPQLRQIKKFQPHKFWEIIFSIDWTEILIIYCSESAIVVYLRHVIWRLLFEKDMWREQ
jgi:hypothetical protein